MVFVYKIVATAPPEPLSEPDANDGFINFIHLSDGKLGLQNRRAVFRPRSHPVVPEGLDRALCCDGPPGCWAVFTGMGRGRRTLPVRSLERMWRETSDWTGSWACTVTV